jgi:hypothetical protein
MANRKLYATLLFIFVFALVPRIAPQRVFSVDETRFWFARSFYFLRAVQNGEWEDTIRLYRI